MKMKNKVIYCINCLIFFFGIMLILKSNSWGLGSYFSMNLAGSILCFFSGCSTLIESKK